MAEELKVPDSEDIIRWVLSPRNYDPLTKTIKNNFISLRKNGEKSISFFRFMFAGAKAALENGETIKRKDLLLGGAIAKVKDICDINREEISVVTSEDNINHAGIIFVIDGECIVGSQDMSFVHNSKLQYYFDEITKVLKFVSIEDFKQQNGLVTASVE